MRLRGADNAVARCAFKNSKAVPVYGDGLFIDGLCVCSVCNSLEAVSITIEFAPVMADIAAVEPEVTPVAPGFEEAAFTAIADEVPAVMANINAVMADIAAVGERCLGLGSNSGKEEADGE